MILVVVGVVFVVAGIALRLYGDYQFFNVFHWMDAFMNKGVIGPGRLLKKIGNILIIAGIVLILIGINNKRSRPSSSYDDSDDDFDIDDDLD